MKLFLLLLLVSMPLISEPHLKTPQILKVGVVTRLVTPGGVGDWEMEMERFTVSGRPVQIVLKGYDARLRATLTPVVLEGSGLKLHAESIITLENGQEYRSEVSLEVETGEKVLFYPAGKRDSEEHIYPLVMMELFVLPFEEEL